MYTVEKQKGKLYIDGELIAENIDAISDDELKDIVSKASVIGNSSELADLIEDRFSIEFVFSDRLNRSSRRHHASYEATRYKRPKKNSKNYF